MRPHTKVCARHQQCGSRVRRAFRRRIALAASEDGFTLVELLVVTGLLVMVIGVVMKPIVAGSQQATREISRAAAISEAQTGLYRMTRELRQATTIYAASANQVDVAVSSGGTTQRVLYKCDVAAGGSPYNQCKRASSTNLASPPNIAGGALVIDRVFNNTPLDPSDPVFTYSPNAAAPTYISFKVVVASSVDAPGGYETGYQHSVTLNGGAYLVNQGVQ